MFQFESRIVHKREAKKQKLQARYKTAIKSRVRLGGWMLATARASLRVAYGGTGDWLSWTFGEGFV